MGKKLTTEEFIAKSKLIFNENQYDYSETIYINGRSPVTIYCNSCQDYFSIKKSQSHLQGCGCNLCHMKRAGTTKVKSFDVFLEQAKITHGDLYDYDCTSYRGTSKPLRIFCKTYCQWYWQVPGQHLRGRGHTRNTGQYSRIGYQGFLSKAEETHGDFYDYSNVSRDVKIRDKIKIICPLHGPFFQTAGKHLSGSRCRECANLDRMGGYCETNFQRSEEMRNHPGCCYLVKCTNNDEEFLKIGITKHPDMRQRKADINHCVDGDVEILDTIEDRLYGCFLIEQHIKRTFQEHRYHTSVIFDGHTECLHTTLENDLLAIFESLKGVEYEETYTSCVV